MTGDEAIRLLEEAKEIGDTEVAHATADNVLCELLIDYGFEAVVRAWEEVPKWYA